MLLGGWAGQYLNSVELYNWETNQTCQYGTIPKAVTAPTGTFMDGFAVFCGGQSQLVWPYTENLCYKYNSSAGLWMQVC